jgi:ribonuclease E
VIVQVTKDPVGPKGARLTSQVSLPGRYLVYVPGASMTGISRKLPDTERNRLKHILKKVTPENGGVIVRTAAEGAAEAELERDVTRLAAQWESIEKKAKTASAPALLYGEPELTVRVIRDVFNEDFSTLLVSGDEGWDVIDEYVRYVAPHLAERVERWGPEASSGGAAAGADDVFAAYRIDEQLAKALERKVWLPSGGSLIIDRTEAMTVIDVNTGKFTGQGGNLEETVTRNNLEAAEEIVRQLRLRDIGGIVVIDFIDMVLESNRELVLRRMLECLARDRTKHQVAEVTSLGLVQMTRKRVGAGLLEAFSEPCEHCNGRGVIVHFEPMELPGQHPHRRNGNGQQGYGGGSSHGSGSDHNGRREPGAGPGAPSASAVTVVDSPLDSLGDSADSTESGRSGHGSRRNRRDRDRDRGGRHGSPSVAHAIVGMASATLAGTTSGEDFYSVDPDSVIDEAAAADPARSEGGTPAEAAGGQALGVHGATVPATDIPPAPPGRRTRSGSATVRRVTTTDEPVATVVTVPPVEAELASPVESPAEEAPADEAAAEATVADESVAEAASEEPVAEVAPEEPGTGETAVPEADALTAAEPTDEAISEAEEVTEPAEAEAPAEAESAAEAEAPAEAETPAEAEAPVEPEAAADSNVPAEEGGMTVAAAEPAASAKEDPTAEEEPFGEANVVAAPAEAAPAEGFLFEG